MSRADLNQDSGDMRIVRGEELATLERAIERAIACRAYELFSARGFAHGHDWEDWFHAESELIKPEPVRITDTRGAWVVHVGVPGFSRDEIQVGVSRRKLLIWGQHQNGAAASGHPTMLGEIDLPSSVIPEQAFASMKNSEIVVRIVKEDADSGAQAGGSD